MIPDRFTVTSMQQLCVPKGAPVSNTPSSVGQQDSVIIDNHTGALTVCWQPPSLSQVQDFFPHFNMTA